MAATDNNLQTEHSPPPARPGFIGELVVQASSLVGQQQQSTLSDHDIRQIQACAVVQHTTGALLLLACPLHLAIQALDLIQTSGGDLSKTLLTRMDYYYHNTYIPTNDSNGGNCNDLNPQTIDVETVSCVSIPAEPMEMV